MAFTRKKKKSSVAFEDEYFLKLTSNDYKLLIALSNPDEAQEQRSPFLTFGGFEELIDQWFEARKTKDETLKLGRVEIVFNNEGKFSSEEEGFIETLVVDETYQNILLPLSEMLLNHNAFSSFTFEDKISYLKGLYKVWQESTSRGVEFLPQLPQFEPEGNQYIELEVLEVIQREFIEIEPKVEEATKDDEESEESQDELTINQETVNYIAQRETPEFPVSETNSMPGHSLTEKGDPQLEITHLTHFEVKKEWLGRSWQANDPDFVVGQLNLAKHHFNEEISKRDEQVTQIQQAILNKKISILENIETQGLNAQIKVKDRRAALKNSLLKQEKESVDQKLDVLTQEVTKEKELKLSDAKQSYEHQIQLIELEASKNLRTKKEALEERSRREIQDKIRQAIEQETAELMRFIQEQKRLIEQKIRSEKEKIEAQFQEVIGKQDHELQAYYLYLLEQKKRTFENEAKEALAQLKQSESKSESAETLAFKQQIVDLKAQVKEMSQKIQDLKSPVIAQEEPLEATSEVTSKEADKTTGEKMSKRTLETTLENTPETTLESNQSRLILKRIGWLMLILLAICITAYGLGFVGVKLFSH